LGEGPVGHIVHRPNTDGARKRELLLEGEKVKHIMDNASIGCNVGVLIHVPGEFEAAYEASEIVKFHNLIRATNMSTEELRDLRIEEEEAKENERLEKAKDEHEENEETNEKQENEETNEKQEKAGQNKNEEGTSMNSSSSFKAKKRSSVSVRKSIEVLRHKAKNSRVLALYFGGEHDSVIIRLVEMFVGDENKIAKNVDVTILHLQSSKKSKKKKHHSDDEDDLEKELAEEEEHEDEDEDEDEEVEKKIEEEKDDENEDDDSIRKIWPENKKHSDLLLNTVIKKKKANKYNITLVESQKENAIEALTEEVNDGAYDFILTGVGPKLGNNKIVEFLLEVQPAEFMLFMRQARATPTTQH